MTIPVDVPELDLATDGVTTEFPLTGEDGALYFMTASDLVFTFVAADGTATEMVSGVDYTVSGDGRQGEGVLATTDSYADAGTIAVRRATPRTQTERWDGGDGFDNRSMQNAQDRGRLIEQDQASAFLRAIRALPWDKPLSAIPGPAARAMRLLAFGPIEDGAPPIMTPFTVGDLLALAAPDFTPLQGLFTTTGYISLQAAQIPAGALPLLSTRDMTVNANLTLANTVLHAFGGIVTVDGAGAVLTLRGAIGDRKLFNCINGGRVVFTAPGGPISSVLFCDPTDGHGCDGDFSAYLASQPFDHAYWKWASYLHHFLAEVVMPSAHAHQYVDARGFVSDHAIDWGNCDGLFVEMYYSDARLNTVPVGQKVSGWKNDRGKGSRFTGCKVKGFPEDGFSFGMHMGLPTLGQQVAQARYINCHAENNGRCGIKAAPQITTTPRNWWNGNKAEDFYIKANGQNAILLTGQSNYNTLEGYAETNNVGLGARITAISVDKDPIGGDLVSNAAGATARISRFNRAQGLVTLYDRVADPVHGDGFKLTDVLTCAANGAQFTLAAFCTMTVRFVTGSWGGTFPRHKRITFPSGVQGYIADFDATFGILALYEVTGATGIPTDGELGTVDAPGTGTGTVTGKSLYFDPGSVTGDFSTGDPVTNGVATGTPLAWDAVRKVLQVGNITGGAFAAHDVVTQASTGNSATVNLVRSNGAIVGGGTDCAVLATAGGPGAPVPDQLVTGDNSSVQAWLYCNDDGVYGLRGVNPHGDYFSFLDGEHLTGGVDVDLGHVTTAHLGGGWSASIFVSGGDTTLRDSYIVGTTGQQFVIDASTIFQARMSVRGGRLVGEVHGNPVTFQPSQHARTSDTWGITPHRSLQVDQLTANPTIRTVTASPYTLDPNDPDELWIVNDSGGALDIHLPISLSGNAMRDGKKFVLRDHGTTGDNNTADVKNWTAHGHAPAYDQVIDTLVMKNGSLHFVSHNDLWSTE